MTKLHSRNGTNGTETSPDGTDGKDLSSALPLTFTKTDTPTVAAAGHGGHAWFDSATSASAGSGGSGGSVFISMGNSTYVDDSRAALFANIVGEAGAAGAAANAQDGAPGGLGGDGGNGADATADYVADQITNILTMTLSGSALATDGAAGGNGGNGLDSASGTGGDGGHGGAGGEGGDALAQVVDSTFDFRQKADGSLTFNLVADAGNGGQAGTGGTGGTGPSGDGAESHGGTAGNGGNALISFSGNSVTGHNGDDTLAFDFSSQAGTAGALGSGDSTTQGFAGADGAADLHFVNNTLDGGGGINTLDFTGSTVDLSVNLGNGSINGQSNTITNFQNVLGGSGDDTFVSGGPGENISGGDGNDTIVASAGGGDNFTGGNGDDTFVFGSAADSTATGFDRILDLNAHGNDMIDLSGISPNIVEVNHFNGGADEMTLHYDAQHNLTLLAIDLNGDKVADVVIHLANGDYTAFTGFIL